MSDDHALQDALTALLKAEGLAPEVRGSWVVHDDAFPALRARATATQLHVELSLYDGRIIAETYPLSEGLRMFGEGPLRVFLSTFWARHDAGKVVREVWKRDDGPWLALIGPYMREVSSGERLPVPYPLFGALEAFVRQAPLDQDMHWLSLAISMADGRVHAGAQLDNIDQPALAETLRGLVWPDDGRTYALRNFILLARL
ncbi:DUF6348 family protein [Asticcacaulis sp. EMRT-3]|uniref:DUF6348 family protein n=1 Tax=Asticcacaulis sp. EMRT-3 TaxID=3040349 RepID=UPI0024AF8332|nr:DUF6348 family protein [Asticcacaulis sp. EMRT-3]MDI7773835.1 DUF6348 family protein [Asticcacaulis sp. EMRT-3]